jgi:DNA-binding HxlR family transcriptional regulator
MKAAALKLPSRRSGCPISYSLDILGDRWTLLLVRDIAIAGKHTFGEFLASDEGIATNILADRLARLVCAGVLRQEPLPGTGRRSGYYLTERGLGLIPVLLDLVVWGAHNDPHTEAPPEFIARAVREREIVLKELVAAARSGGGAPVAVQAAASSQGNSARRASRPATRRRFTRPSLP